MSSLGLDERISRFVIRRNRKNYCRADNTVKHNAFMPAKNNETSVFRTENLTEDEIWDSGETYVSQPQSDDLLGRADISKAKHIIDFGLGIDPDNTPPNHANIIDWPIESSEKKSIAQELAAKATCIKK